MLALPPARRTQAAPLEPCRPITSPHSVPALENQHWRFGPLGKGDTPSGTAKDTRESATRDPETEPHSGTHVHSQVRGDMVTHTQVHTDTHEDTQGHTSENTATLRYLTHPHQNTHMHNPTHE